jgi:hypothetical protein
MTIEYTPALLAGVIAAILMIAARMGMKKMGMPLQMDVLSMLGQKIGKGRIAGMSIHVALGAIFALPYALGFDYFGITEKLWLWGTIGGFIHWIVAGALLGMMPGVSAYAKNFGKPDMMGFLIGHLLFGLFVGTCYAVLAPLM